MKRIIVLCALCILALAVPAMAQTPPTPTQSTVNLSIGAGAFGLGGTQQATPASDITLQLNPGLKNKYFSQVALLSDNLLASNLQYFGGGLTGPVPNPFPTSSAFGAMYIYWRGSVGADRITDASGHTQSNIAFLAGGGLGWRGPSGLNVTLIEVDDLHAPGALWGNNAPAVQGSISWIFGHANAAAAARRRAKKTERDWLRSQWSQ